MNNYTDALIESQIIAEDVIGNYSSNYLNLGTNERIAAMQEFKDRLKNENVFDFELMHKALDVELEALDLLKIFKSNGEFVSRSAYGNLVSHPLYHNNRRKADPLLSAIINLWAKVYGNDRDPDMQTVTAEQKDIKATSLTRADAIRQADDAIRADLAVASHRLLVELTNRHPEYNELCSKYDVDKYTALKPKILADKTDYLEFDSQNPRIAYFRRDVKRVQPSRCIFKDETTNTTVYTFWLSKSITGALGLTGMIEKIADTLDQNWDSTFEGLKGYYNID